MVDREKIQFDLVKLLNGGRILRLTEPQSGLTLEKKLAPTDAVVRQKEKLLRALEGTRHGRIALRAGGDDWLGHQPAVGEGLPLAATQSRLPLHSGCGEQHTGTVRGVVPQG